HRADAIRGWAIRTSRGARGRREGTVTWLSTPRRRLILAAVAVLLLVGGLFVYINFFRQEPAPYFASDEDHFLYGSVGTEPDQGVPYWIWLVLPRVFPEHLPAP